MFYNCNNCKNTFEVIDNNLNIKLCLNCMSEDIIFTNDYDENYYDKYYRIHYDDYYYHNMYSDPNDPNNYPDCNFYSDEDI